MHLCNLELDICIRGQATCARGSLTSFFLPLFSLKKLVSKATQNPLGIKEEEAFWKAAASRRQRRSALKVVVVPAGREWLSVHAV